MIRWNVAEVLFRARERPRDRGRSGCGRSARLVRSWPPTMTLASTKPGGTFQRRSATRKSAPLASTARPSGVAARTGGTAPQLAQKALRHTARSSERSEVKVR